MTTVLGRIVPEPIKSRYRPRYHAVLNRRDLARRVRRYMDTTGCSALLPEIPRGNDLREKFEFAKKHFKIAQIYGEIEGFLNFAQSFKPRVVGEIGLLRGGNTCLFLLSLTEISHFYGLDIKPKKVEKLYCLLRNDQSLDIIRGNSHKRVTRDILRWQMRKLRFDLLFIDGDHSYQGVKKDFLMYKSLVRPGGIIALHDIIPDSVARGGPPDKYDSGEVYRFWAELKSQYETYEFVHDYQQCGFGIGAVVLDGPVQDGATQRRLR